VTFTGVGPLDVVYPGRIGLGLGTGEAVNEVLLGFAAHIILLLKLRMIAVLCVSTVNLFLFCKQNYILRPPVAYQFI
jgi:hypothetical protein